METPAYIISILIPLATYYLTRPKKASQTIKIKSNTEPLPLLSRLPWYNIGLLGIFCLSAVLRFKDLSRFNSLVFDEHHFVNFANKYLNDLTFFDVHPPLAKLLIAIGIWIGQVLNLGEDLMNNQAGDLLSPLSYRWMNALVGSLIPVLMASLTYKLSQRRAFALITGYFAALDGLFIVESRYALLEVYIVFFGLVAQLALLKALKANGFRHHCWLALAGIGFGAAVSSKWSGLAFWGCAIALWVANEIFQRLGGVERLVLRSMKAVRNTIGNFGLGASVSFKVENGKVEFKAVLESLKTTESSTANQIAASPATDSTCSENLSTSLEEAESGTTFTAFNKESPLSKLGRLGLLKLVFYFGIIPLVFYYLQWVPHLALQPDEGFFSLHRQMLSFHNKLAADSHAYCASWDTWPLMMRPICFYFQKDVEKNVFEDVHSFGNPFLWWFSTFAIVAVFFILVRETLRWIFRIRQGTQNDEILPSGKSWISLYVFVHWTASFLPYTLISRCAFIYHYMPSVIYTEIALAWLVDNWLRSKKTTLRVTAAVVLFVVSASFVFFAPIFYGTPLDRKALDSRMWFRSWI